ncbi:hypothetical protein E1A91_A04G075600v1 [Gossypium mustelinum]|uniref:Uncharacterized protein n=1 Tax=Gossypium mustelinum TaxID=34275 RepID=A0A5D2ZLD8_GOSMU|nr:hypothetical protein E1A91_A04G075600v1 [Gossypium mustelinum]
MKKKTKNYYDTFTMDFGLSTVFSSRECTDRWFGHSWGHVGFPQLPRKLWRRYCSRDYPLLFPNWILWFMHFKSSQIQPEEGAS